MDTFSTTMEPHGSVLDALVLVARKHGVDTNATSLSRRFTLSGGAIETPSLLGIAEAIGLRARGVMADWGSLPRFRKVLPAILMLRNGGALVLDAVVDDASSGRMAVVRDPQNELRAVVDERQLSAVWNGEIILVKRRLSLGDENQPFSWRWLIGQITREPKLARDIAMSSLIASMAQLAPPFIVVVALDRVLLYQSWSTLQVIAVGLVLIIAIETLMTFIRTGLIQSLTVRIDGRMNLFILDRILRLPIDYFEHNPTGTVMTKLSKVWFIRSFLTGQLLVAILDLPILIVVLPILFLIQWILALAVVACGIVMFLITYFTMKPMAARHRKFLEAEVEKGAFLYESVAGMRTIKSLALEGRRRTGWDIRVATAVARFYEWGSYVKYPTSAIIPFDRAIYVGSILGGVTLALISMSATATPGVLTPGSSPVAPMAPGLVIGFAMLARRAGSPLTQLATLVRELGEVRSAIYEVASVVNQVPEDDRAGVGLRMPIRGDISFQNVSFRYSPGATLALEEVSFQIPPGTIFGIMGRSGSGKTTVTRLLQGLNPGYEGIVKIDGMDLREIELNHLRTHVGVVAQENFLFRGTVRENIGMARPDATFQEIVRAAQLAGAEEFIEKLPRGYDTWIEESAANLSGGQRQRLAIARALIIDPPVLILDEATSALDAESEAIINANLQRIAEGRTIICVSHRLSMLVPANAIMVMERGRVYDIGRHEELLYRCDIYKHLWHQQNRHVEHQASHAQLAFLDPQRAG